MRVRAEGLNCVLRPAEGLAVSDTVPVNPLTALTETAWFAHHHAWGYIP